MNGIESWLMLTGAFISVLMMLWLSHRDGYHVGFEHGYTEAADRHRCVHEFYDHAADHAHA